VGRDEPKEEYEKRGRGTIKIIYGQGKRKKPKLTAQNKKRAFLGQRKKGWNV